MRHPWRNTKVNVHQRERSLRFDSLLEPICSHVDEEDKGVTKRDTLGGTQKLTFINESGLYSLILRESICSHVDEEYKGVTKRDTLGGTQKLTFINESSLIFDDWTISRLDDRRWREEEAALR